MKKFVLSAWVCVAVCGFAAAQQPAKIAVIHIQQALIGTKEGQKAAADLQSKFEPRKKSIEEKQREIQQKQSELSKGGNTMAEAKRIALTREIDTLSKSLQRETQDAQDEFEQEQNKILNELGQRMMVVIDKYAKDNGYALVIDISSQQTPVLWAANNVNITDDIVTLYDKSAGAPAAPAAKPPATPAAKPPAAPAAKPPAAPKP
jgi:outer membrane protein